ncbi:MAG: catechol 2,3-dioxygenase-like lactoylglutathione lyase family enzyme [Myxococcota bacterium]
MIRNPRFIHTNLVSRDYRTLAAFYADVFGCVPLLPERDYPPVDVDPGTGLLGVGIRGMHMRLPGVGDEGPTLEILEYSEVNDAPPAIVNRVGQGHIAFEVENVSDAQEEVVRCGGSEVGEITFVVTPDGKPLKWCYVRDPEGNMIELSSWY